MTDTYWIDYDDYLADGNDDDDNHKGNGNDDLKQRRWKTYIETLVI